MTRLKHLPLVVLIVLLPYIAGAEMYQWVDGAGVKHYSNDPPPAGTTADSTWGEIKASGAGDSDLKAREAAIVKETESANRQRGIDAAAANQEKASKEALDAKRAELKALGERIASKRRYVKRRGKTDINKIQRLNGEIAALKKDPNADPGKIKNLETEVAEIKDKFYQKSGRGRKGVADDVERYHQLELEIEAMEQEILEKEK